MASVHFTTIPCELNRAISTHRKPYFGEIHSCTNKIVYSRFEVFRTFLCVIMSGIWISMRYELWVNVRIAIFFGTVDICQIYRCVHHCKADSDGWSRPNYPIVSLTKLSISPIVLNRGHVTRLTWFCL